ncbi:RsmB/NOP family class I SAM-dependent RNA methyltransferase, partial [Limosilactobacillus mucosae]|nr:RsmB/NOP family class I SAM-dependent RNA methyltransferase [Limosilactobacillus mucosae]
MKLPTAFIEKYRQLLGDEADAFLASFDQPSCSGFRINPLKNGQPTATIKTAQGKIEYVADGWFGKVDGKSLDHTAGWVYSQEPSAMYVGEVVDPKPGERVLDLCAAPGGKSTHLIAKMHDEGLLVANEIFRKRANILAENLERWGAKHAIVMNESPAELEKQFPQFFDRILVDAPCSG